MTENVMAAPADKFEGRKNTYQRPERNYGFGSNDNIPIFHSNILHNKLGQSMARSAIPGVTKEAKKLVYTNLEAIKQYLTDSGGLLSRRFTGLSQKEQKMLRKAVKVARRLGLLCC